MAEILAFSGPLSRAGCLSQVAEGLRSKRGMGSTIMAKSLVHVMWLTTLTFKDPEVIGTLEAPGWHNPPGLSPHPLFPIPCLFLNGLLSPTPYAQPHRGAVGRWGRGREGVGKVPCFPVYRSSLLAFSRLSETCYFQRATLLPPRGRATSPRQLGGLRSLTYF